MEPILAYQPGVPFEIDTALRDGHVEVKRSRSDSDDAWIVRAPEGELFPIENDVFLRTYFEVFE